MDKKALILLPEYGFRDDEYEEVKNHFEEAGIEYHIASSVLGFAHGIMGGKVEINSLLDTIHPDEFDAFVLIGGHGVSEFIHNPLVHHLLISANNLFKKIAAIGTAPLALAYAGVIQRKRATMDEEANHQAIDDCGGYYTASNIEQDDNIITAVGHRVSEDFAHAIVESLVD